MKHAVVRTDLMSGTKEYPNLVCFKYMGTGNIASDIDNGHIVKIENLMDSYRDVYKAVDIKADIDSIEDLVLVASVELMYDEYKINLDEFYNEAGKICRGYRIIGGRFFSVTKEALVGDPKVGDTVTIKDGTQLEVNGTGKEIGQIIAVEKAGQYMYYVIQIGVPYVAAEDNVSISSGEAAPGGISGKKVSDLIGEDVVLDFDGVTGYVNGTLNNVSNWEEFSDVETEQSGHYFPLTFNAKYADKEITCIGSTTITAMDTEWVLRVDTCKRFTFKCDGKVILILDFTYADCAK